MKNKSFRLIVLFTVLIALFCYYIVKNSSVCGEFEYVLYQSTGLTTCIVYNGKVLPINISENSDRIAYQSYRNLKPGIIMANSKNGCIIFCGCYNKISHKFKLQHWYITTPFLEAIEKEKDFAEFRIKMRRYLKKDDFDEPNNFNPYDNNFNPSNLTVTRKSKEIIDKYKFDQVDIDEGWLQRNFQEGHILITIRTICSIIFIYILLRNNFFNNSKNSKIKIIAIISVIGLSIAIIGYIIWILLGYLAYYFCWGDFITFGTDTINRILPMFFKFLDTSVYSFLFVILLIALIKKPSQPKSG